MISFGGNQQEAIYYMEQEGYVIVKTVKNKTTMKNSRGEFCEVKAGVVEYNTGAE